MRHFNVVLVSAVLLALALSAGCGGRHSATPVPDDSPRPATPYPGAPNYGGYYGDPYGGYYGDPFGGRNLSPLVSASSNGLAPRGTSNFLSSQLAELGGAFDANFASLHQQQPYGVSDMSLLDYLYASNNAGPVVIPGSSQTAPAYGVALRSDARSVSFVTYGLYDPQANTQIQSVELEGAASTGRQQDSGLYVGIRQFGEPRYRWYGPFQPNDRWRADAERLSTMGRGTAGYVTLAVFNGDEARIDRLSIELGR
jgi:hypothetical protein